ncbi:glycosyltransferase family 2 protein [Pelobium manganitolerans]|uniref:glycosyltransferase family 2 protein n=1 Tax=Pelobium manganitolerans TaxID=1842495 RepID=UPI003FA35407
MLTASIVLFENNPEDIEKVIKSCLVGSAISQLYIIDNSPTNKLSYVAQDAIIYYHTPSNPGFGASHNLAINKAKEMGADFHLVLNPDIYFGSEVISRLLDYLKENPSVGNIMPKVLYPDGNLQYLCKLLPTPYDWIGRRFNPFKQMVNKRNEVFELKFSGYDTVMEVPYLSGCFMFLRMEALDKVGLFDENIFMYGEETDLCRRLISAGYKTVFYPHVHIYHHFAKGSHKSWRLTKIGVQSAIYYFNKWGWFYDKERSRINAETLKKLDYYK